MLEIHILPVLSDNYIFVLHENNSNTTGIIDPALAEPVISYLTEKNWPLDYILNTHHHSDHVGGNISLKEKTHCTIIGSEYDIHRIPGIDISLRENSTYMFGSLTMHILFLPGHTSGHIAYWFPTEKILFCGDALFSLGCGRLFEGTAQQMYQSLEKIKALPDDTIIYCTHEYTERNGEFALTLEPNNIQLQDRFNDVQLRKKHNQPTIPTTLALEKATNPFLRTESAEIRKNLGMQNADPIAVFAEIRKRKDSF